LYFVYAVCEATADVSKSLELTRPVSKKFEHGQGLCLNEIAYKYLNTE
jgi:hypothetical protein